MAYPPDPLRIVSDELVELLDSKRVVFGLRAQGHIPTIEQMLAEGASWNEIGKAIGWHGPTAKEYYERYEPSLPRPPEFPPPRSVL
jgi:hypothetical protein